MRCVETVILEIVQEVSTLQAQRYTTPGSQSIGEAAACVSSAKEPSRNASLRRASSQCRLSKQPARSAALGLGEQSASH